MRRSTRSQVVRVATPNDQGALMRIPALPRSDSFRHPGGSFLRRTAPISTVVIAALLLSLVASSAPAQQQAIDEEYTAKIKEFTTEPFFLTPLVDYLPASDTVPTPLDFLGHISGAADVLTYPADIHRYMRAVADASDRVEVVSIGQTEEGREMILVIVADEATLANLDEYKARLAGLADPREISEAQAQELIDTAKPIYWATGAIHSGETGSPEMLMELVYRLAVDGSELINEIRDNLIVMVTPVIEVDGRAKQVDVAMAPRKDPDAVVPRRLLYWGEYVAHDNNRDGMGLSLKLTQNVLNTFLEYKPTVMHDLHESASHLYVSTGRGPYNAWVDPIVISEWNNIAYKEVKDMTAFGVPGVYTHDFYDGWAPNYMFWIANMRNSIGRFYETQGAGDGSTRVISSNVDRNWSRPSTPLRQVMWGIRNNVNLQQSAILIAMNYVATHREEFLQHFFLKSQRSVAKATTEGPAAYVFPADDARPGQQARLLSLLQRHGIEVSRADAAFSVEDQEFAAGSYVVRMDQPYSRAADMLLDTQFYNPNDTRPYDDVGWTHGPLYNVETVRVEDTAILDVPMQTVADLVAAPGGVDTTASGSPQAYVVNYNADNNLAAFRFAHPGLVIDAAEESFSLGDRELNAGSFIIRTSNNDSSLASVLDEAGGKYGFTALAAAYVPDVPAHPLEVPRVAVMHTWQSTQTEGWLRVGLDEYGIPYDYISVHEARDNPHLRDSYDVIVFGPSSGDALSIMRGVAGAEPVPWKKTELTPNLGYMDETDDMRGGLGLEGVLHLAKFVEQGGVLVTIANSASLPTHFGLTEGVTIKSTPTLWARGGVFKTHMTDSSSPIGYGYGEDLGVYFNTAPVFRVGASGGGRFGRRAPAASGPAAPGDTTARGSGRGTADERDIIQGRPRDMGQAAVEEYQRIRREEGESGGSVAAPASPVRTVFRFAQKPEDLLISGGLQNGKELANAPALVDVALGEGHVVMFSFNPFWRGQTLGSYALLFNTLMHYSNLDAGLEVEELTEES